MVGGSWGVTLGLVYAQRHPERILGLVLAAVTAGTWRETRIAHIPATMIHGRYDVSGPLDTAWSCTRPGRPAA